MATDTPGRHGAAVRIRLQVLEGRVSQSAAAGLAGGRSSAHRPDGSRPAAPSDAGWEPAVPRGGRRSARGSGREITQENQPMRIYIIGNDGIALCREATATV